MKKTISVFVTLGLIFCSSLGLADDLNNSRQISNLKKEIISISKRATARIRLQNEFNPETRKKLDPLVKKLVSLAPPKSPEEQLVASVGAWQNLWSDLPFTTSVAAQIYQVVFADGYYYNISKFETESGSFTSFLRGEYRLRATDFEIIFTKAVKNPGFYPKNTDLYRLAMLAELGIFDEQIDERNQGGLNRAGTLTTLYIDKDIRIVGGELEENGVTDSLFVLVPRNTIK
jgi:hypothetical protein